MNNLFDTFEKYMFGLLAVVITFIIIFAFFLFGKYEVYVEAYVPFPESPMIEIPEEEVELQPENIMVPSDYNPSEIKNTARDENDKRKRSNENYSVSEYTGDGAQKVYDLEKEFFESAGGADERARIEAQNKARKLREEQEEARKKQSGDNSSTAGTSAAAAGNVMVSFNVPNHTAFQGNDYYVRNPGYKCGEGSSGTVMVRIKVDQSGNVLSADYDPSQSRGNVTPCMISEAEKYAKISRFNYSSKASKSQSGWITYTFISQ